MIDSLRDRIRTDLRTHTDLGFNAEEIRKQKAQTSPMITTAAGLAHHGLLLPISHMDLYDIDLAPVPAEHLASLVSLPHILYIMNVTNTDIVNLLDNIKCNILRIGRQSLSSVETQALVRTMESNVGLVSAGGVRGEVSLDIPTLTTYSGQGKCREFQWRSSIGARRCREEVISWAQRINWAVTTDVFDDNINTGRITIERV